MTVGKRTIATPPGQKSIHQDLTEQEAQERQAEIDLIEAKKPLAEWKREILESDEIINARVVEDIFDALPAASKTKIPEETKDKFSLRKEIRKRKPSA